MDTLSAFARGQASRNREPMVFDWDKAARLIKDRKPRIAGAGLQSDWEWTGGTIYKNGETVDDYTFLSSTWATPEICLDGEYLPCYIMASETEWGSDTKWPESALEILNSK